MSLGSITTFNGSPGYVVLKRFIGYLVFFGVPIPMYNFVDLIIICSQLGFTLKKLSTSSMKGVDL